MKVAREISNSINWLLDNLLPPVIRDSKFLMTPLMRVVLGPKYRYYLNFKQRLPFMSDAEIESYYTILADTFIERKSDLNNKSIDFILKHLEGDSVIDVGCGRGYLISEIAKLGIPAVGFDVAVAPGFRDGITYQNGSILNLPYADKSFDTVICAHVLEHIRNIDAALNEIKRITKKRLIIVLPKQREYKYTFDLHIHFFPYLFDFQNLIQSPDARYYEFDKDFLCVIQMSQ